MFIHQGWMCNSRKIVMKWWVKPLHSRKIQFMATSNTRLIEGKIRAVIIVPARRRISYTAYSPHATFEILIKVRAGVCYESCI